MRMFFLSVVGVVFLSGCFSVASKTPSCDCVEVCPVKGAAASLLPEGRNFKLVWHDEFEGTSLDDAKWGYRTNFWGVRAHWFAAPEDNAVEVKNGCVHLKIVKKPDGQFVSPQLQTAGLIWDDIIDVNRKSLWLYAGKRDKPKFEHRYGYYECRCRLQQMPDWWSAFWMQSVQNGASLDPARSGIEQDIMESFVPGEVIQHAFHLDGYGADYRYFYTPRRTPGETSAAYAQRATLKLDKTVFHVFGLLWEPDGYTIFVDGKQHGEKVGSQGNEAVSQVPEFILLTTEARWYRNDHFKGSAAPGLEAAVQAKDDFVVDYVRVWDFE